MKDKTKDELIKELEDIQQKYDALKALSEKNIAKQKRSEESLHKREEQFRLITEQISEMIYVTDNKGLIIYVSKAVEKIFGFSQTEMVGNHFSCFLYEDDISKAMATFQNSTETVKNNTRHEFQMKRKDNSVFLGELRGTVFKKDGVIGTLGIIADITERKHAELALKENEKQLLQLNTDKDRFLSILGHDLKSPFNTLIGFSKLLSENIRNYNIDKIEGFARKINDSAQNTYHLLDELLMWANSQSGKIPFSPQRLSLADICKNIIELLNPNASTKNITISCLTTDHLTVYADSDMLRTILRNLVSNAIKFTNKGGAINIAAEESDSNVTIAVSDNGIGIAPGIFTKMFDISEVLTTKGTAEESGTGLGLLLCKEFVEKHGGLIWIESEIGKGSDIKFTLPKNDTIKQD